MIAGGVIAGGKLIDIGRIDEIGGAEARVPIVRWRERGVIREERMTEPRGRLPPARKCRDQQGCREGEHTVTTINPPPTGSATR